MAETQSLEVWRRDAELLAELTEVLARIEAESGGHPTHLTQVRTRRILLALHQYLRGATPAHVALRSVAREALALAEQSGAPSVPPEVARLHGLGDSPDLAAEASDEDRLIDRYNREDMTRLERRRGRRWGL